MRISFDILKIYHAQSMCNQQADEDYWYLTDNSFLNIWLLVNG